MGNSFQYLDILLLAGFAAFLIWKLRSALGRRGGHEQPPAQYDPFRQGKREEQAEDKVIQLPDRAAQDDAGERAGEEAAAADGPAAEPDSPLAAGLTQIKLADRSFDAEGFVGGAKAAFEMIVAAFAQGDTRALRPLLSNDVFDDFAGAIKTREEAKETLETTLVGVSETELIEAELQGKTAFVTVKFVSDQINVTRDKEGEIVEGNPNQVATITDIWTFARNTRSRDPNWTLVATRSSN